VVPGQKTPTRQALIRTARSWAQNSLETSSKIQPPERDEECDVSCAVATHNLGEFAEMEGKVAEARKLYEEAQSLAKAMGFEEGVVNSDAALKRLGNG
jgi:hypothetical protein